MEEDNADKAAEQEAGDGSKPRNGIRSRWEKYKKEFAAQQVRYSRGCYASVSSTYGSPQLQRMFDHHRKSPWFTEKYEPGPEFQNMRIRVRKSGWKGKMDAFILDLESGKFDPDLSEPVPESASPVKENSNGDAAATNGAGGEGSTTEDVKPSVTADDEMQFNVEAEEDAGGDETNRASSDKNRRGANRGEELAVPPEGNQVMIRTIPPDIGRAKLEEVSITRCPSVCIYAHMGCSQSARYPGSSTSHWVTHCRSGTTTVLAGSSSVMRRICPASWLSSRKRRRVHLHLWR